MQYVVVHYRTLPQEKTTTCCAYFFGGIQKPPPLQERLSSAFVYTESLMAMGKRFSSAFNALPEDLNIFAHCAALRVKQVFILTL